MPKSMLVLVLVLVIMPVFVFVFVSVLVSVSVSVSVFGTGASWRRGFERWILAAPSGCSTEVPPLESDRAPWDRARGTSREPRTRRGSDQAGRRSGTRGRAVTAKPAPCRCLPKQ